MQSKRKNRLGHVISDKMDKTVVVEVETSRRHPISKKVIRKSTKYKAHDVDNECKIGDVVRMEETRPLSRLKRWRVAEIVKKAEAVEIRPEELGPSHRTDIE